MLRRRPRLVTVTALTFASLTAACAGNDATTASPTTAAAPATTTTAGAPVATDAVIVKDFAFGPRAITIKAGTTVTWTNQDAFDHSIVDKTTNAEGPHFGPVAGPRTFTRNYPAVGAYPYFCGIHNSMTGTVIVTS